MIEPSFIPPSFIPPALTSTVILAFLLYSFKKRPDSVQYKALFILCLNTLWWHLGGVFLFSTRDIALATTIAKLGHVGILALPFTFHYFYSALIGQESRLFVTKICLYVFFLSCLVFTDWIIQGVSLFSWGYYPKAGILHPYFLVLVTYFVTSSLVSTFQQIKRTPDPSKRKTLQICQAAGVIYGFGAVDFLVNYKLTENYPFGFLFSIIFIATVSYAVIHFDLFSKEAKLLEELKQAQRAQKEGDIRLGRLATQVVHDLRSPLAALNVALSHYEGLQEDERLLFENSINRIRDIANELLVQARATRTADGEKVVVGSKTSSVPLPSSHFSGLIESLLIENRARYRTRPDLKFESNLHEENKEMPASIQPSEFNRVLSNLIDNAVESIEGPGTVTLSVSQTSSTQNSQGQILITVSDNGRGIHPDVLSRLGQKGASFGKKDGNGLGLYHAISTVKKWGGNLTIDSKWGVGTQIRLTLPEYKY